MTLNRAMESWLAARCSHIGQIQIEKTDDAAYQLRHRKDAGQPWESLTISTNAEFAGEIAKWDDAGQYRPLKTAPNLRRGWGLHLAAVPDVRLALDVLYPGRLAALLAYEHGRLAVTPLRATLGRQSGMYRVAAKLTDAQADALAGRFCRSDGGCLRTILWRRDAGGAAASSLLPAEKYDPGYDQTGLGMRAMPLLCQEACNLLVAEARKVVKGEG